jgi:hypothetical protein
VCPFPRARSASNFSLLSYCHATHRNVLWRPTYLPGIVLLDPSCDDSLHQRALRCCCYPVAYPGPVAPCMVILLCLNTSWPSSCRSAPVCSRFSILSSHHDLAMCEHCTGCCQVLPCRCTGPSKNSHTAHDPATMLQCPNFLILHGCTLFKMPKRAISSCLAGLLRSTERCNTHTGSVVFAVAPC